MEYPIFNIKYGTLSNAYCNAVVAEESSDNAKHLLENKFEGQKLDRWKITQTDFSANKKGIIFDTNKYNKDLPKI